MFAYIKKILVNLYMYMYEMYVYKYVYLITFIYTFILSSIYSTFHSPWIDNKKTPIFNVEPKYYVPESYRNTKTSPPAHKRIKTFPDEVLFYGFYGMSKDVVQEVAAKEL